MPPRATRIAVLGPHGYGWSHRRAIHRLQLARRVRLVAFGARGPVRAAADAPTDGVPFYRDHQRLLAEIEPDVVVIATPTHAHLPLALDCAAAGADLLVEKPAVASLADFEELMRAINRHNTACQVGFQALASPALRELVNALHTARLGPLRTVSVVGSWWRSDAYFGRNAWAGQPPPAVDGAVANQFSHAIVHCLAIAEAVGPSSAPAVLEIERYRAGPISVDDTACLRITRDGGVRLHAAVTIRGTELIRGDIAVVGGDQRADLEYPTDRLRLPDDARWRTVTGRVSLLDNLLAHRDGQAELVAPLRRTEAFTAVLEAVLAGPAPTPIERRYLRPHPAGDGLAIAGIADLLRGASAEMALFSEVGVPWARKPHRVAIDITGAIPR